MKKTPLIVAIISIVLSLILFLFWLWGVLFPPFLPQRQSYGSILFDRDGQLLSLEQSSDDFYFLPPVDFADISPFFLQAVVAVEDNNFFAHGAVDVPAVFRAALQNIVSGRIVSGGSTLSLQLAKKILGNTKRTLMSKWREVAYAFALEKHYSKEDIFALWSNMAPFSGNIVGIHAASWYFFHKPPHALSLAQSAYLAGIPKNPSRFSPARHPQAAKNRQRFVLSKMREQGFISEEEYQSAIAEELHIFLQAPKHQAPFFSRWLQHSKSNHHILFSSLSLGVQEKVKEILQRHLSFLSNHNAGNAAAIVLENATGAVLAYVGNSSLSSSDEVDVLRSYRQVGSTLKPFLYLLAFERLHYTPDTIVFDEPTAFPATSGYLFEPKNFDLSYKGKMTVRQALGESRNIPATATLSALGANTFLHFLKTLGFSFLNEKSDMGLALALGASEVRPLDLARAYMILAREGEGAKFCTLLPCPVQHGKQLFSAESARRITRILADNTARIGAFGEASELSFSFDVAAKTGTTRNFNDNYAVGFSPEYTVLVWVGNTDGGEMREISGISGAGPIFHDIFLLLSPSASFPSSPYPSSSLPPSVSHLRILSPLQHEHFRIDALRPRDMQKIAFRATVPAKFFLDGTFLGEGKEHLWIPVPGTHRLEVVSKGETQSVVFTVE